MMAAKEEKTIYELFRLSLLLKAIGSIGEILAGVLIAFVPGTFVLKTALLLTQGSDADDFIAQGVVHAAHAFSVSNSWFLGTYIFIRGLVQFLLVIALFKNKLWAYPMLMLVLFFLVVSQGYDVYLSHSIPTAAITIVDLITIYLVWHEYQVVRKVRAAGTRAEA